MRGATTTKSNGNRRKLHIVHGNRDDQQIKENKFEYYINNRLIIL